MKSKRFVQALRRSLVALAVLGSVSSTAVASYSQVVFFGDSLSDTGNLYRATGFTVPASPPYFNGRFSNGPLWSETLAGYLGLTATPSLSGGTNNAWAGATVVDYGRFPPELPQQLDLYLLATSGKADPGVLYVILGGANDINDAGKTATPVANVQAAAQGVDAMVDKLYGAGARNILVSNLPDIGLTPRAIAGGVAGFASALTNVFNATLAGLLDADDVAYADLDLDRLDLFALLNNVVKNPASYGFGNVTDPCLTAAGVCADPGSYLFWDDFHPTTRGHSFIADTALRAVPEPTTLLLIGISLAAFGLLASRRGRRPETLFSTGVAVER